MELLILCWPLLPLTLVPTAFTVSLTSSVSLALPITIAPPALLLTPSAALVTTLSGWSEALIVAEGHLYISEHVCTYVCRGMLVTT